MAATTTPCSHTPPCPSADSPDREAAHTLAAHPGQGWSLLCNGVLLFEDTGELLPNGGVIAPHRPTGATGESDGEVYEARSQRRRTAV
ncbi:DUF5999 family protein [Streptomyces sp. NPDC002668]|uniref:DUF5999 family protein n=1 Tax=Streptomyces sp. NPDC002668 TaxID=3154422 RepID=UPI0033281D02